MNEWYSPSEIRFWVEHIEWIILHLDTLEQGYWPPDSHPTGYTDVRGPKRGHRAYFEVPVCIAAEVTYRLKQCGADGMLARKCLADGWDIQSLAELMKIHQSQIETRVKRVLLFCSGWRRRRITFDEFKRRYGIKEYYRRKANRM